MTNINPPSRDNTNDGSLSGLLRFVLAKHGQSTEDMLPAQVIAYNRASNTASVQPFIVMVTTSGVQVQRAQIASVPVFQYGGGGYLISFPIASGDYGWLKATDRDLSIFKQTLAQSPPNTLRTHSFEDGMFFPDIMNRNVVINGADASDLVIQSIDSTTRISIGAGSIKMTATNVAINATHCTMSGDLVVTGNVTGNAISLDTHVHNGVQTGSGDTGPPV